MQDKIEKLIHEIEDFAADTKEQVETFRIKYLSKKGVLADLFAEMKNIEPSLRKDFGQLVNELKTRAESKLSNLQDVFLNDSSEDIKKKNDLTLPAEPLSLGSRHPLSIVRNEIVEKGKIDTVTKGGLSGEEER